MYKLLTQYPDILLCNVIRELRADGLFVVKKRVRLHLCFDIIFLCIIDCLKHFPYSHFTCNISKMFTNRLHYSYNQGVNAKGLYLVLDILTFRTLSFTLQVDYCLLF